MTKQTQDRERCKNGHALRQFQDTDEPEFYCPECNTDFPEGTRFVPEQRLSEVERERDKLRDRLNSYIVSPRARLAECERERDEALKRQGISEDAATRAVSAEAKAQAQLAETEGLLAEARRCIAQQNNVTAPAILEAIDTHLSREQEA